MFEANSRQELLNHLKDIDITVPPRNEGRTTKQVELWSFCRLLSTIHDGELVNFPLKAVHGDRPDFEIHQQVGGIIGIEFTEAIPQQFAWAVSLRDQYFPDAFLELDHFRWGAPNRTKEEILKILEKSQYRLSGMGWYGDSVEQEWAHAMKDCTLAKAEKLNNKGFRKFSQNWLLIYDNVPSSQLKIDIAMKYLDQFTSHYWANLSPANAVFDTVFVEVGDNLIHIQSQGWSAKNIVNLWEKLV